MADKSRKIALTITANSRQLRTDLRRAGGEVKTFERQVMGLGQRMRNMRMRFQQSGIFGRGGGALRTAAGFAGAFGIQQMFQGAKEENAALTDIAITGNLTDKQLQKLRKTMFEVSNATAKSTSDLTSFVATVTTMTGDAQGASEALAGIGEVMVATGASGEALAGTYVKLTTTMGLMPKQAKDAFNILRSQEKLGSVTLANIAANFGKIVGAAGVFGAEGKGLKGTRTLGGLFQIAQRGFGVGQETEAATSAAGFLSFMGRRSKKIKKEFGVDVFNKSGQARDLPTVLEELGKAFIANPEKFRTKGQLIFGRAGIRTAQQLAEAARAPGGFSGKLGSFASANALLRTAGGEDIIGKDAARRRRSASFQFDEQINILKNSFKKHLIPVFKTLATSMKDFGPDLVRVVKFLLENSRGLLKLWLGYKGVTFFRNLMAPIQGGPPGAAGAIAGAGSVGASGGFMLPGGQMVGGSRAGGFYTRPKGQWSTAAQRSAWGVQTGVMGSGGWGAVPGGGGGGWRRRSSRFGTWARGAYGQYGAGARRAAGMGMGAATMMDAGGGLFSGPSQMGDMAGSMALMSGNPYAMAAGGFQKASNAIGNVSGGSLFGNAPKTHAWGMIQERQKSGPKAWGVMNDFVGNLKKMSAALQGAAIATKAYYTTNWRGFEEKQRQEKLMAKHGFDANVYSEGPEGAWGMPTLQRGMSPEARVRLAGKLGETGLKTLSGRIGSRARVARSIAVANLVKTGMAPGDITEADVSKDAQYSKLKDFQKIIDSLIMVFKKGYRVNVNTVSGMTPGQRAEGNSTPPTPGEAGGGVLGSYILGA